MGTEGRGSRNTNTHYIVHQTSHCVIRILLQVETFSCLFILSYTVHFDVYLDYYRYSNENMSFQLVFRGNLWIRHFNFFLIFSLQCNIVILSSLHRYGEYWHPRSESDCRYFGSFVIIQDNRSQVRINFLQFSLGEITGNYSTPVTPINERHYCGYVSLLNLTSISDTLSNC